MILSRVLPVAALMACLILHGCAGTSVATAPVEQTVYDRVMSKGKIRCGYVVYTPGCLKDPNSGELSGIGTDALKAVAKTLGLEIEFVEEVGWGSMIEGLQTNRYDIVSTPIWTNANRAKQADFSDPLFFSPIFVYARKGDQRFGNGNLSKLNSPDFSISTIDGETAEIIAREDFPKAKTVSLPQLTDLAQMLLTVDTGKADVTFMEPASAAAYIENNPGKVEIVKTDRPIRVFSNCWMFKRGQMEFKNMLDTALAQLINSGAMEKILAGYEPSPNTLYRTALPYRVPAGQGTSQ